MIQHPKFYNSSTNIESISIFSYSDTHQSHHFLGWHATNNNYPFNYFLSFLHFTNLVCLTKKAVLTREKNNNMLVKKAVLTRENIKTIFLTEKLM